MSAHRSKSERSDAGKQLRRDPYEVLGVTRNCTEQEIKSAYRKMALNDRDLLQTLLIGGLVVCW